MGGELSPGQATGETGFSLIELLVVVAIVSVLAVGVTLSVGRGGNDTDGDMARFRAVFELNAALAVEGRAMRGLELGPEGLRVLLWRLGETGGTWQPQGAAQAWRGRVAFAPVRPVPSGEPEVVFLPSGQHSAFSVVFGEDGGRCESDGWAGLTCG